MTKNRMALAIVFVAFSAPFSVGISQPGKPRLSVVQAVAPVYPPIAATAGASGMVTIEVRVKSDGRVSSARVVKGAGVLAAAATNSARRWVFAAAEVQSSMRTVRLIFVFKIMASNTPKDELSPIFKPPYEVEVRAITPEAVDTRDPVTQATRSKEKEIIVPHGGRVESKTLTVLEAVTPGYPPLALSSGISGEVRVRVAVNHEGIVTSAKIIDGHRLLREGCKEAGLQWKFAAAVREQEGERTTELKFVFIIAPKATATAKLTTVFKYPTGIEITRSIPQSAQKGDRATRKATGVDRVLVEAKSKSSLSDGGLCVVGAAVPEAQMKWA